ncbi:head GIN domain-containing protein [Methanobacterium petrolearium]|uniref:head GIN domain-containing protein n=1 Tax=Methanobacterium petrolearium TaxID=710190 RepID=UPI001AE91BCA|nr:head GIN domain-containing protein [Methanobacterium petrolearium]MBP1944805.1 hypothetical protein [Methanobacterium petrolearium]BDZ70085.1 DUF2807 domain-containing protein [Methanobacterium petrolearium]
MGKMFCIVILGILLCIVVAASGCTNQTGTGNQTPDVSGVTSVTLNGPGTLIIQQGDNESYRIEAKEDLMAQISTTVSGNTLSVSNLNSVGNGAVKIYITLKDLNTLTTNGGGNSEVTGLDTDKLTVTLDNGKMTLTGKAENLIATINGGGNIAANDLEAQSATVTINGDGKANVNVISTLNAVVNGGGSITYTGSPQVNQQVNGQGSIKQG